MKTLVHDGLRAGAARHPDKPFLIYKETVSSFGQVDRDSDALAAELQAQGIVRGDRVAVLMENSAELVTSVFGILKAGAVLVIINPTTKDKKLAYVLNDCGVRALMAQPSLSPVVGIVKPQVASLGTILWTAEPPADAPAGRTFSEVLTEGARPADPGLIDDDLCSISYTSGTTGEPKGVMLTHRNMANTAWAIATYLGNVPEDVVVCVLPLSFNYGLYQVIVGSQVGCTLLIERSFAYPYQVLKDMARHRVTGFPGVPTIFATLLQMLPCEGIDLSRLRYLTNAAAALPPAHIRRLREVLPHARLFSMYGLTECSRVSYLDPDRLDDKIASVGKAIPNSEVYVVDEAGRRCGPRVVGELVIRGAHVMRGYWGKPSATAERLRDGAKPGEKVLYSGDLFYMDEEGFLYFVGRKDDVFKCKGEKISPREIENVLYELEAIAEAAVIGVEDPIDGYAVKALVAAREGRTLTEQQVRQHCRARLENYMVPKFVEIRESLPKTESGKIKKSILSERSSAESCAASPVS